MAQQFIVIRNMPTPGSEAALALEARNARKAQRRGITFAEDKPETIAVEEARALKPSFRKRPRVDLDTTRRIALQRDLEITLRGREPVAA